MLGQAGAPGDLEPVARLEQRPRPPPEAAMDETGWRPCCSVSALRDQIVLGVRADLRTMASSAATPSRLLSRNGAGCYLAGEMTGDARSTRPAAPRHRMTSRSSLSGWRPRRSLTNSSTGCRCRSGHAIQRSPGLWLPWPATSANSATSSWLWRSGFGACWRVAAEGSVWLADEHSRVADVLATCIELIELRTWS